MRSLISRCRKIQNESGESLVETIVAFLVVTIVLLAFAAMVTFGFRLGTEAESLDRANTNLSDNCSITFSNEGYSKNVNSATAAYRGSLGSSAGGAMSGLAGVLSA